MGIYGKDNAFIVPLASFSSLEYALENAVPISSTLIEYAFAIGDSSKKEKIVLMIKDVELMKNMWTPKKNVLVKEDSLASMDSASSVQQAQQCLQMVKHAFVGTIKFTMKFQTVAKIVVLKISNGVTTNVNAFLDTHGGIKNVEDALTTLINPPISQLVFVRVIQLLTTLKQISVLNVEQIIR